ncbi:MAG: SDR family oxidoreductase [Chloroflexota bacterium]|nr:MAG: SDR family oxidoreductase [Chloroflexota bacterium]
MAILDRFSLIGRTALVTGASHGIGEACALAFAEAGADVALSARSVADLDRVAGLVAARGRKAFPLPLDLSDVDRIGATVAEADRCLGGLDIVANVAGNQRRGAILDITIDDWNYVMDVQLRGAFFVGQAAGRIMCQRGKGKVIHIASMTSFRGFADISLYGMAKTAVVAMARYMAVEWATRNVQVNAIAPGWIETPMTVTMAPARREWVTSHVPVGRYGAPDDVAACAVYLASSAADYVTGQTFPVDGGFLAGNPWPRLT